MRKYFLTVSLLWCVVFGQAQNWNEWFRQKETQISYYIAQIGALQLYIQLGQKGYDICEEGLSVINDIKQGDFNLHNIYFTSLSDVKPVIARSPSAQQIPVLRKLIISISKNIPVKQYPQQVSKELIHACDRLYAEYLSLLSDKHYALKDEERLKRIDGVYAAMLDQYLFIKDFMYENHVLDNQREHERNAVRSLRRTITGTATADP